MPVSLRGKSIGVRGSCHRFSPRFLIFRHSNFGFFISKGGNMVSEPKRIANRKNAQKSTGPKSKEGKEKSSQNARTHGLFCHALLLPHDDKTIFHTMRRSE